MKKFFEIQNKELKAYARHIRRHIEKLLFDEWVSGGKEGKSILQIEKYSILLRQDCEDRIKAFKEQISKLELQTEEHAAAIKEANREWEQIGWVRDAITNASSQTFAKFKTAKCNYYIAQTKIESYNYAVLLLQHIGIELNSMILGVQAMKQELVEILDHVMIQASSKCQIESKLGGEEILKKYNPEVVHALAKQYASDYDLQHTNASEIRQRMISMLGEEGERSFANLNACIDFNTASDLIIEICSKNAHAAMEDKATKDPLMKMVGVNILDKLRIDLNSDEKIEAFVDQLIRMARSYIQLNPGETAKVIGDNVGAMMTMVQVALPQPVTDQEKSFVNQLGLAFQKRWPVLCLNSLKGICQ